MLSFVNNMPNSYDHALKMTDCKKWPQAMNEEIESLKTNNLWDLVYHPDDKKCQILNGLTELQMMKMILSTKLVQLQKDFYKRIFNKIIIKQERGRDYNEAFASVAKITTLRIVLAVANHNQLFLHQIDIKTAFLNGELLEEAYMK